MELNGFGTATSIIARLIESGRLSVEDCKDLEICLDSLEEQKAYVQAAEHHFVQLIRHHSGRRYNPDLIPKYGYRKSYNKSFIDDLLAQRLEALDNGGRQCLFCGSVAKEGPSSCPECQFDYAKLEGNYDAAIARIK